MLSPEAWRSVAEGEDLVEVVEVEQYHQQAIEADGDTGAVRHAGPERREQLLVERILLQSTRGAGGVIALEARALFARVGQFGKAVGKFDAVEEQFEAFGNQRIFAAGARQ